ncbi:hypothetical protein Glove_359g8 [Diversispora epigaea]|uniref:Uncharacterized protein n=1 Tax=Diversispora epigaea TaxID=1348612 RepID=A0A397HEN0_9GLOM|nr:hypothetical protein Glove_359g8 [Diversispora epigaea]
MSHKLPVTTVLDSSADYNIISEEIVNGLGLKINDSSDVEVYNPISKLSIIGVIRKIEISILSQGPKWKQVRVTDIFVVNSSEHVLNLGQPWFKDNAMEMNFPNKTLTLLAETAIPLVIRSGISPPTQLNCSIDIYNSKNLPIQDLKNCCSLDDIWKAEVIREIRKRLIVDCTFIFGKTTVKAIIGPKSHYSNISKTLAKKLDRYISKDFGGSVLDKPEYELVLGDTVYG